MRVVALVSGGKDSTYNMMQCIAAGHKIVALANLVPHTKSEIDSYMYQSVGHEAISLIAEAIDLPLFTKETEGISRQQGKNYEITDNDEVEDLFVLLQEVRTKVDFDAVSVGAILSDYQRVRVENVCLRLGLTPLAYLWQRNQEELLDEMLRCEVDAIIIKVAALGLEPSKHLGRSLSLLQPHLLKMHEKYALNVCGEGGEYETLTLDCPLFRCRIVVEDSEVIMHSDDAIAPVAYLKFNKLSLELKLPALDLTGRLEGLPLKSNEAYAADPINDEDSFEISNKNDKEVEQELPELNLDQISELARVKIDQRPTSAASREGWLWIGGVQGRSSEPFEAMRESMSSLKSILESFNHTVKNVCSISMFVSDMSEYAKLNQIYVETFNHVNPPSRACVEVLSADAPIIIEALSWKKPENWGDTETDRLTMHVQSISHWAPCNIGPYSQAVKVGKFIHLAGQIGLIPGNMQMISGGIQQQSRLVLRHISRLLSGVDSNVNLRDVVQGICYVTQSSHIEQARNSWEARTNNAIVEYVVVAGLPRGALIEWHVWAHKHNNQFEYEERGKCIDNYSISLYRRVNYENNIAAIVCRVENPKSIESFDSNIFLEALTYSVEKLKQGHENHANSVFELKIFYSIVNRIDNIESLEDIASNLSNNMNLVYTFVPVVYLKNKHTVLSICGVRNQ